MSGTTELPIETLNELQRTRSTKVAAREVCRWPEWKALAARLGIPACNRRVVLTLAMDEVATVDVQYLVTEEKPCHTPPSDTAPSASGIAPHAQTTPTPAPNGDTTAGGTEQQTHS